MFLFRFMQKYGLSSSRAYCIFAQPANSNGFIQLPIHDFNNRTFWTFLLVDLRKIQYARDDERPHFCINLNNIDNEVYCDIIVMLTSFQTISSINYGTKYYNHFSMENVCVTSFGQFSLIKTNICRVKLTVQPPCSFIA
jgi:hypothetical protein